MKSGFSAGAALALGIVIGSVAPLRAPTDKPATRLKALQDAELRHAVQNALDLYDQTGGMAAERATAEYLKQIMPQSKVLFPLTLGGIQPVLVCGRTYSDGMPLFGIINQDGDWVGFMLPKGSDITLDKAQEFLAGACPKMGDKAAPAYVDPKRDNTSVSRPAAPFKVSSLT